MLLDGLFADPEGPSKIAFTPISTEARRAFQREILPQIGKIKSVEDLSKIVIEITAAIREASTAKDTLYTRLVRHKAIDQVDDSFFANILTVLQQWSSDTLDKLREAPEQAAAPKTENRVPKVEPEGAPPPPAPAQQPVVQQAVPVQTPQMDPVQALREDLAEQLGANQNMTPWDLVRSLQTVFQKHGVWRAYASARSKTAVTIGFGTFGVEDVVLRQRPGQGWGTALGLDSKTAAREIMVRMARAG